MGVSHLAIQKSDAARIGLKSSMDYFEEEQWG
jgi:hypothetical protein